MDIFFIIALVAIVWVLEDISKTLQRIENKLDDGFPAPDDITI